MTKQSYKERRDEILEAVRIGGWYDANPNLRESDYMDTDIAAEALDQLLLDTAMEAVGEDVFVPESKSWIDGMMDKPKSYKNNHAIVQWAKRENEILAKIRTRIKQIVGKE